MSIIIGHFAAALVSPANWSAALVVSPGNYIQPNPANGYIYLSSGGTTGAMQPTWPVQIGAQVVDNSITWTCAGPLEAIILVVWDQEQSQTLNGDLGGTWSPATPITFLTVGGGQVQVTGLTQIANNGTLFIESGATLPLGSGDFPRNAPNHSGRNRRIVTSPLFAVSTLPLALRADFALNALDLVANAVAMYEASSDDLTVTVTTTPVQWTVALDVHNTATLRDAVVFYRANQGSPRARMVAISSTGEVVPLTSAANGADADGYVTAPSPVTTDVVQTWSIPIDGGASPANAVVSRDANAYVLEIIEDQSSNANGFPYVLPLLTPVICATTGPIDMASAPSSLDASVGGLVVGARVLVKNQLNPEENGIYLYPGAGQPFAVKTNTPIMQWVASTAYSGGALVQPAGAVPGAGIMFKCTTPGTSAASQPNWALAPTIGLTVSDGSVVWTNNGPVDPYTYQPTVEIRTYGYLQGMVVQVLQGARNQPGSFWQYTGPNVDIANLGQTPVLPWVTIPTGFSSGTIDVVQEGVGVFAANGNAYHAIAVDHVSITTQAFQ